MVEFFLCVSKCVPVCMCVRDSAGKGREEETLIEIPSAMSGRALVSEWHTHTHTHTHTHPHTHIHTGPGPNKSGLCHMEAMCKTGLSMLRRVCACAQQERLVQRHSPTDRCMQTYDMCMKVCE